LTYLERLRADPTADEALRLELARAYHRIGVVQGSMSGPNLGERERASQSFQYAVKLLRPLAASGANRQEAELELGRTALDLSNSLVDRDNAAAIAAAREALTLAESLVRRAPADEAARRLLGSAHFAMATRFVLTEVALPHWSRAGEMFEALLAERPDDPDRQRNVALVNKYLGAHYQFAGDLPRALAHNLRALELDERRVSADPANRQAQIDLAIDLGNVAEVHRQTGRDRDAAEGYERSLVIRRRLSETDPKDDYARGRLAYVHVTLAPIYAALGRSADALRHGRAGLTIADARAGIDERNRLELIDYLQVIGRMEKRLSLPRDGCAHLRRAAVLSRDVDLAKLKGRPTLAQDLANALAACGG
jgi:non-specific serine/threonine protein kinase/serine/threonine-protein kinase